MFLVFARMTPRRRAAPRAGADGADGGELLETQLVDPQTGRVAMLTLGGRLRIFHPVTFDLLGALETSLPPLEGLPWEPPPWIEARLAFDPSQARAFLLSTRHRRDSFAGPLYGKYETRLDILDLQSLQRVASAALLLDKRPTDLVVLHRPPVPTGLTAQVDGSQVTLSWTPGSEAGKATSWSGVSAPSGEVAVTVP